MDFSSMSGWDFERYCADCLLKKGFTKAEVTSGSGDHGVDIIAEQNGIRFGIQCKLYQGQIPNKAVQEAYTGASFYDCDVAVIMSNSKLTKQADEEARKLRVKFWNVADYTSEEVIPENLCSESFDKLQEQNSTWQRPAEPTSYQEYIQEQEKLEIETEKLIKDKLSTSPKPISSKVAATMLQSSCQFYKFSEATEWIYNRGNNPWRCVIRSIECYTAELERVETETNAKSMFLGKLKYIKDLRDYLNSPSILGTFERDCKEIAGIQEMIKSGSTQEWSLQSIDSPEFDLKYWATTYWAEQYQIMLSLIKDVFDSLKDNEILQISEQLSKCWYPYGTPAWDMFDSLKNSIKELFETWTWLIGKESDFCAQWILWIGNDSARKKLMEHYSFRKCVLENVIEYRENFENKRLNEQEQANTACKLNEYQTQQERKRKAEKQSELEKRAKSEIDQAQKQIRELLKRKESFTLFRKKRDTELDAKIAVLDRYIEHVKQNLADELAKCEQDAETKRNTTYMKILDGIECSDIKSEFSKIVLTCEKE